MLYSLKGKLIYKEPALAVVECGGVGFKCAVSMATAAKLGDIGSEIMLFTHLNVREDAMDLFGFSDIEEQSCFKMLISVSGVGPKAALAILSELTPERFALCVAANDTKSITRANGVGPKLAQRIVLELKDKVSNADITKGVTSGSAVSAGGGKLSEAISALVVLGYQQADAAKAVSGLDESASVEELIKHGLKALATMK